MVPLKEDDKCRLLSKLEGIPHFERTLTAKAVASCYEQNSTTTYGPTMPAWFVREHGESILKSVLLLLDSSTDSWRVTFTILVSSKNVTQVIFNGSGWKAFVTSNGLKEGDSLVFALKAMSEFKVFVFRSNKRNSSSSREQPGSDFDRHPKKAQPRYVEYLSDDDDDDDDVEGNAGSVGLAKKKKPVADDAGLAPQHSPPIFQDPSCMRDSLHLLPGFWKTLTMSNIRRNGASLEIPLEFYRTHGRRINSPVKLQGIHGQSPVRMMVCTISNGNPVRHFLRGKWTAFAAENRLQVGQQLHFTLAGESFFVVRKVVH